jgi:hypothetical protein
MVPAAGPTCTVAHQSPEPGGARAGAGRPPRGHGYLPTDDVHRRRAFDAQRVVARSGRRRAVGIVDLVTAVLAAEHGMTVLHRR